MDEEVSLVSDMANRFLENEIAPFYHEYEKQEIVPRERWEKAGENGLLCASMPEEFGGAGGSYAHEVAIMEAIGHNGVDGFGIALHSGIVAPYILHYGSEEQKQKWLPKLAHGEWIGAWGLTEHNTGSDAGGMSTTAKQDGDYYVLNGAKNFITHGISGDIAVVVVRTGEKGDSRGMTSFVVEKGTPGFSSGKKEDKMGMRASETAELIFDNCRIHKDNILGEVGEGFIQSMKVLDGGRISIGALALGISKGAYEASLKYSKEREQFGRPISKFQSIAFKLADMLTEIEASELLLHKAASMKNKGEKVVSMSAMAKMYASEVSVKVANEALQIHGGYGYTKDFPVEKFYRDAKLCTIGEGTTEIQKLVISRNILA